MDWSIIRFVGTDRAFEVVKEARRQEGQRQEQQVEPPPEPARGVSAWFRGAASRVSGYGAPGQAAAPVSVEVTRPPLTCPCIPLQRLDSA